jgi:YD repeat-containing protein
VYLVVYGYLDKGGKELVYHWNGEDRRIEENLPMKNYIEQGDKEDGGNKIWEILYRP